MVMPAVTSIYLGSQHMYDVMYQLNLIYSRCLQLNALADVDGCMDRIP